MLSDHFQFYSGCGFTKKVSTFIGNMMLLTRRVFSSSTSAVCCVQRSLLSIVSEHSAPVVGELDSTSVSPEQRAEIGAIPARLSEQIDNEDLLIEALTHKSFHITRNNGRLSLLGKSIVSQLVMENLFFRFPNMMATTINDIHNRFMSADVLGPIGRQLGFQDALLYKYETPLYPEYPKPHEHSKRSKYHKTPQAPQKIPLSATADAFQAFVAALYIDKGFATARSFTTDFVVHVLDNEDLDEMVKLEHPKLILQHINASNSSNLPLVYKVVNETGRLSHLPTFEVSVLRGDEELGRGAGFSLLSAQQDAARTALKEHFLQELDDAPLPSELGN
eukprot:m.146937 g.146937  ORF g.146937 m.146937 type:complete len:334 (-) comp13237_c2_seq31:167-1168(-)